MQCIVDTVKRNGANGFKMALKATRRRDVHHQEDACRPQRLANETRSVPSTPHNREQVFLG
jgi:hypothetical protein